MRAVIAALFFTFAASASSAAQGCAFLNHETTPLTVRSVRVEGGGELNKEVEALVRPAFLHQKFWNCELGDKLREPVDRVRFLYQNHGYMKVRVQYPAIKPQKDYKLDLLFAIEPGAVYRVQDIRFTNATVFPASQLRAVFSMNSGEIWNASKFQKGIEGLRQLYGTKGYINFTAVPTPEFDDQSRTVVWTIDADEGSAFTFGPLVLSGLEPQPGLGNKLIAAWQPYLGKPFTPASLKEFAAEYAALSGGRQLDLERDLQTNLDQTQHVATVKLEFPTPLPR